MPDASFIPIIKPLMGEPEAEAARRPILSGWVTQGPEVAAFEKEFAAFTGSPHACAVSNCTAALHMALLALGVGSGDEVVTVSHSYIATANAIRYCGAIPVFVDVDRATYNMNAELLEAAIAKRTRAILCVHQIGMPSNLAAILPIAARRAVPVIEDAACSIGSEILWDGRWEKIGKPHANIACFSFHPRKIVTTGDGGMLTTASAEFDRKFRLWRHHSMSVPDTVRHKSSRVTFEEDPELGFRSDGGMLTTASAEFDRKFRLWRHHSMSVPDTVRHKSSRVTFEEYPELGFNYRSEERRVGKECRSRSPP